MIRSGWMAGAKALAATTALSCAAMVTAAQADVYDYIYINTSQTTTINGSFQTTIVGIGPGYSNSFNNITSNIASSSMGFVGTVSGSGGIYGGNGQANFNITTINSTGFPTTMTQSVSGPVAGNSNVFSFGSAVAGLFTATDRTPSSGGGGGGGSGGASTPEVNAGLGVLIAGASFAFLWRKRGGRNELTAT